MSNYTKSTDFASKDNLTSGDPLKIVKGTEIDTEFNNIATAVATKADLASPTFTGTVTIPTVSLTNDLPVTDGGTGASTAADARTNLSAAKSGSNSDITALSGLTTALSVSQGGTGATSITSGAIVRGNGTSALSAASSADIVAAIGSTAVANATTAANGGVTSVNGQTGAVDLLTFGGIGTYAVLFNYSRSSVVANTTTISASSLGYVSSVSGGPQGAYFGDVSRRAGDVTTPGAGTGAYVSTTAVSGTWRCISGARASQYDPCTNETTAFQSLFVRIA